MTTLHTGDECGIETLSADNAEDVPAQPALETSADSADETEPEPAELNESSDEMEHSLRAPTPFNADTSDLYTEWKHWMSAFKIYAIASGLVTKPDAVQWATLLHCLGPAVQRIFNTLPGEHENYDDVKASLNSYFAPKRNVVAER